MYGYEHLNHRGVYISVSGAEGSGKTTQLFALQQIIADEIGRDRVVLTREPGGTNLGRQLRALLLAPTPEINLCERAEMLLFAADRHIHLQGVVLPSLQDGKWVLSDRSRDDTIAYQGHGRGLPMADLLAIDQIATAGLKPDVSLFFDIAYLRGLARKMQQPAEMLRFENERAEFHDRVRMGFLTLATQEPDRILVIDADQAQDEVTDEITNKIRVWLRSHHPEPQRYDNFDWLKRSDTVLTS